jgi:fructose-1,6-bisphosphatase II
MDRNLALESIRITEAAALASARVMGRGDRVAAGQAAVEAMRKAFDDLNLKGQIVIGEGARDDVKMLSAGEQVGRADESDQEVEIAVDPLEGTNLCATGAANAMSIIAIGQKGSILRAPDAYMEKIVVGPAARGAIDITKSASENLRHVADALGRYVEDLTVVILDRARHERLIREVREAGARIQLIGDGDVAGALNTCFPQTGVDVLMGVGGAPEGVIAAAALRCVGGDMQARLVWRSERERQHAMEAGLKNTPSVLRAEDLAGGDVMFAATGVTNGDLLRGVRFTGEGATTHSLVMRSKTGTIRYIETIHHFKHKPNYGW